MNRKTLSAYFLMMIVSVPLWVKAELRGKNESVSELIQPIEVVVSSTFEKSAAPTNLINPDRINKDGMLIGKQWGSCWLSANRPSASDHWVYLDLGGFYEVDQIQIWNYYDKDPVNPIDVNGRAVKGCSFWVASDIDSLPAANQTAGQAAPFAPDKGWFQVWSGDLLASPPSNKGPNEIPPGKTWALQGITLGAVRYVGIDIDSRWGKDPYTTHAVGLGQIRVYGRRRSALDPSPLPNAISVGRDTKLSWRGMPCPDASYEVYLSKNRDAVRNGDPSARVSAKNLDTNCENCNLVLPKNLDSYTRYFWRVDTLLGNERIKGAIWTFSTEYPLETLGFDEFVFVKRMPYSSDHNYTKAYNGTSPNRFRENNGIYRYNVKTKKETPVITAKQLPGGKGFIGKFSLSYDAKKVVFDFRPDCHSAFRIWEVGIDGKNLRQLSFPPEDEAEKVKRYGPEFLNPYCLPNFCEHSYHTDDLQPCYLPDGKIVFTSSRCEHGILCFFQPCASALILHKMDADGKNVVPISQSLISEFSPVVMDNGKILYHRWEYIDKGARVGKTFWEMNPDGSKSQELFGLSDADEATGAFMYPQPIPGNKSMIVCAVGPHFPQGNSVGAIKLIDLTKDNRTSAPLRNITPEVEIAPGQNGWLWGSSNYRTYSPDGMGGPLFGHPFPISNDRFLVAAKIDPGTHYMSANAFSIYLIDRNGLRTLVHKDPAGELSCWHPTPLVPRKVPNMIASVTDPVLAKKNLARCVVIDVYQGMKGVKPGSVKYLRINEAIPQYWATKRMWSPQYHSSQWTAALWPRVQWGIVPVEADGSANFYVPANRNIFFQALDENFMELQRERTYVDYIPGEVRSCMGCHERSTEGSFRKMNTAKAMKRRPSMPGPQPGERDGRQVIDYPNDIQPIFDAKCVSCHGGEKPKAGLNLTGKLTTYHNVSFEQLRDRRLAGPIIAEFIGPDGRDYANANGSYLEPMSLGSYKSKLVSEIRTQNPKSPHYNRLTREEQLKVIRWVDSNYQFYGSYYGRHHAAHKDTPDFRRRPTFEEAISPIAPPWHK